MSRREASMKTRSGFSLIEMLIAVTVMALLGTVVIRVFLSADRMNQQALALDRAVALSVDTVERLKAGIPADTVDREAMTALFPDATILAYSDGWQAELLLDEDFQALPPGAGLLSEYLMTLTLSADPQTGGLSSLVAVEVHAQRHEGEAGVRSSVTSAPSSDGLTWASEPIFALEALIPSGLDSEEVAP